MVTYSSDVVRPEGSPQTVLARVQTSIKTGELVDGGKTCWTVGVTLGLQGLVRCPGETIVVISTTIVFRADLEITLVRGSITAPADT